MTSLHRIGTLVALALVIAPACDDSTAGINTGSETHWLAICRDDASCGGTLRCICGTCTLPCTASSDCRSAGASAACASDQAKAALCADGTQPIDSVCLTACTSASVCSIGSSCFGGSCIPNLAPRPDAGSGGDSSARGGASGTGGASATGAATGSGGASGSGGRDASVESGAETGTGGGDAGTGDVSAVATYNAPCSTVGSGACLTHAQARMLVCDGSKWVANGNCSSGTLCDTTPGTSAGACLPIVAECQGATPGDVVCQGQNQVKCGPDLVTATAVGTCTDQVCASGQCTGVCAPANVRCSGNGVQTCDATGQWGTAVPCINQACVGAACIGVCTPTATQCNGNGVETCNTNGQWSPAVPCSSQACVDGACSGTCAPDDTQCSGNGVQTCDATGHFGIVVQCLNQTCVSGACTGVCGPGTRCSGNGVETCNASGQWVAAAQCTNQACVAGACRGVCAPTSKQCSGNAVETCDATGQWGGATPCSNQTCISGACTGVCAPASKRCSGNGVQTCGVDGQWATAVACSNPTPICSSGVCVATPPSCVGLGTNCNLAGDDCCKRLPVTGGTFYRSYDGLTFTDQSNPATVSAFQLDKFEVTVGRFRKFVAAWVAGWRPAAGSGRHTHLNGGNGLASKAGGFEPGWDSSWDGNLPATQPGWDTNLLCDSGRQTWTSTVGANEVRAIICTDWFEGAAFCIWDGGFLPSEAEWNSAAAGGAEQRVYPWGGTTIDDAHAVYCGGGCSSAQTVGTKSPQGDGKYGHVDLAGNAWEWTLDWYNPYTVPCTDCADTSAGTTRVVRGGSFYDGAQSQLVANRNGGAAPTHRDAATGIRCARAP